MHPLLLISFLGSLAFLVLQPRPFFKGRPLIKSVMAIALCVYCLVVPNPPLWIMAAGFALSALGDFLLDLPEDKGFLPGLVAFLCAHIMFVVQLAPYMVSISDMGLLRGAVSLVIIIISALFYIWLYKDLPETLRVPILAYTSVIALMGIVALNTYLTNPGIIIIGAGLFILSDMILAIGRFKHLFKGHKSLNWITYSFGQILLAIGVVYALQCGICFSPTQAAG